MCWMDEHFTEVQLAEAAAKLDPPPQGNGHFELWMKLVDRRVSRAVGVSVYDLGDFNSQDLFDSGTSPKDAAQEALENDDTYSMFMAGMDE